MSPFPYLFLQATTMEPPRPANQAHPFPARTLPHLSLKLPARMRGELQLPIQTI